MITPFLTSCTLIPTTKRPIKFGFTFSIPVLGSILMEEPGPNGETAE